MIEELKAKAADHWQEWLPAKWANLVAEDRVDLELTRAATQAEREIREWMDRGARLDEAEEMVLPRTILLAPEPGVSGLGEEIDEELRQREADYQEMIRRENAHIRAFRIEQEMQEGVSRAEAEFRVAREMNVEIPWSQIRGGEKGSSTDMECIFADEQRLLALFKLMTETDRSDLLATLSMKILISLSKAAGPEVIPLMLPTDEDEEEPNEFACEFLWDLKPPQEPWDYLGESLRQALESAWTEGVASVILGSATQDGFSAEDLMAAVEEFAEESGNCEPPWFSEKEMVAFIQAWRSNYMSALGKLTQRPENAR